MGSSFIRLNALTILACCAINGTQAIPAYPRQVKIVTEKDHFYLSLRGDERCKYAITEKGYTALQDTSGWYYACTNKEGDIVKSEFKVCSEEMESDDIKLFLTKQTKGIVPQIPIEEISKLQSTPYIPSANSKNPIIGERRVLIILMQFNDLRFRKTQEDFDMLFNERNYHVDGAYGSVYDYYEKVSYGQLHLKCDILGPYTASKNMAYYGGNTSWSGGDINPKALFNEAIRFAAQEINLEDYDSDNDGYVDNVHIIFAGYGEEAGAAANAIWSHEMTFRAENIGGMMIDRYSCSPELRGNSGIGITRIGPPCHEIGHALGAMDYYDVDYQTGGYYEGTGNWDIMASGSWNDDGARPADFNPYVKAYDYGWVDVRNLTKDTINIISPSSQRNNIYRINTHIADDYYLLDNRQSEGINSAEPGKGLLIFHIGPQIGKKATTNSINSTYPQQCYIVCASAKDSRPKSNASTYGVISSPSCPYPGTSHNSSFTKFSTPGAYCIDGSFAGISLTSIVQQQNGDISLRFTEDDIDSPQTDEPSDDLNEYDGDMVWSDDFEVLNHFQSQNWSFESITEDCTWKMKSYQEVPTEKEPKAVSGRRYMAMEASRASTIMGDAKRCSCRMTSNIIHLQAGEYFLTGKYGGFATRKISTDTLYIELSTDETGNWILAESLHIKKRNEWDDFILELTHREDGPLRIAFTGNADESSILFLDNVKLYEIKPNNVGFLVDRNTKGDSIYTLSGIYLGAEDVLTSLKPGIYIIRNNRCTKKIAIRN